MIDFPSLWKQCSAYSARPARRVDSASPDARQILETDLRSAAAGRPLIVDSSLVQPRPRKYGSISDIFDDHASQLEFAVAFEDGTYWLVTEEEYEWQVYSGGI